MTDNKGNQFLQGNANQYSHLIHATQDNKYLFPQRKEKDMIPNNYQFKSISSTHNSEIIPQVNPSTQNRFQSYGQNNPQNILVFNQAKSTNNIQLTSQSSLSSNSDQLYEELNKLNPIEKEKFLKMLQQKNQVPIQSSIPNNYYQNELIQENNTNDNMEEEDEQQLTQKQLNINIMNQKLDYKDVWDFYYSAIATIENIALGNSNKKEYGKWDEFNACSFKDKNQLVIQLLKILKSFKGALNDYLKDYNNLMDYPEDMTITFTKIQKWKTMINDNEINKYLDELINIINNKSHLDFQKELNKYYRKEKIKKEDMQKGLEAMIKCGAYVRKEEKNFKKEFEEKGTLEKYKVELNIPPGRLSNQRKASYDYNKKNKQKTYPH